MKNNTTTHTHHITHRIVSHPMILMLYVIHIAFHTHQSFSKRENENKPSSPNTNALRFD